MQGRLILVHLMCRDLAAAASQSIETIIGIDNDLTGKSNGFRFSSIEWRFFFENVVIFAVVRQCVCVCV